MSIQPTITAAAPSPNPAKEEADNILGKSFIKNLIPGPGESASDFSTKLGITPFLVKVEVPEKKNTDGYAPYVTLKIGEKSGGTTSMMPNNTAGIRLVKGLGSGVQDDIEVVKLDGPEPAQSDARFTFTDDANERHSLTHQELTDNLAKILVDAPDIRNGSEGIFLPYLNLLSNIGDALGVPSRNVSRTCDDEARVTRDGIYGTRGDRKQRQGSGRGLAKELAKAR